MALRVRGHSWRLFALWVVVGVLTGVGLGDLWSRTVLLVVPAVLLAAWLTWHHGLTPEAFGLLTGAGTFPLMFLLTHDPDVCAVAATFPACPDPSSPWPFAAAAALLVLTGPAAMSVTSRRPLSAPPAA